MRKFRFERMRDLSQDFVRSAAGKAEFLRVEFERGGCAIDKPLMTPN